MRNIFLIFFFSPVFMTASVSDTINNWQLYVGNKIILFGNHSTGNEGDTALVLTKNETLKLFYSYCTNPIKAVKYVSITDKEKKLVLNYESENANNSKPVEINTNNLINDLQAKGFTRGRLFFYYYGDSGGPSHFFAIEMEFLFALEISIE